MTPFKKLKDLCRQIVARQRVAELYVELEVISLRLGSLHEAVLFVADVLHVLPLEHRVFDAQQLVFLH